MGKGMEITLRVVGRCRASEGEVLTVNRGSWDQEPLRRPLLPPQVGHASPTTQVAGL